MPSKTFFNKIPKTKKWKPIVLKLNKTNKYWS